MDTLVVLSTSAAYAYSVISTIVAMVNPQFKGENFCETSAILVMLIMLGRFLEIAAKNSTSAAVTKLLALQPATALLLTFDEDKKEIEKEEEMDINLVQRGDILKVIPGSKIPTDGEVIFGSSSVDESMITGESLPVSKSLNSTVFGGTLNQQGVLHVKVTKIASESTVSSIVRLVEEAQNSKAPIQRIGDSIASYFVPIIICLSLIAFFIWLTLSLTHVVSVPDYSTPFSFSLQIFISILVISCPCAIGLAVPTAVMVGTGVGAKMGILFKGGSIIELCHKINVVVFDKTGTLTNGSPVVTDHVIFDHNLDEKFFFYLVGSAEMNSEHSLAKAIVTFSIENSELPLSQPTDFLAIPGKGLSCQVSENAILIGNRRWMKENNIHLKKGMKSKISGFEKRGKTVVCVAINSCIVGLIAMADVPRPESAAVISQLLEEGIEVWMLSGDNYKTAKSIGRQIGISKRYVLGGVLPGEKSEKIHQLQKQGKIVAMVGDGINDSPALTQADIGISIATGTDIAIEAADVVLMKNNLWDILVAVDLSKKIFRRIQLNFAWAFLYNLISIPLASGVFFPIRSFLIPPPVAGLSEIFSSVPVVIFSLLLRFYRPPVEKIN
jgi:Cu+-exporting ATPase